MNSLWVCICLVFLTSCNVIKMIKDDAKVPDDFFSGGELFLDITYEPAYRNFYTHSDTAFREIFLDYPWDATLECSSDGGATFTDCGQINTYTWDHANYTNTHVFKVIRDGEEFSKTFTPSSTFPGIAFGACTHNITTSGSMQNKINAITEAVGDVICIADGVVIHNDGDDGAITFSVNDIKVVANTGDYVVLENTLEAAIPVVNNLNKSNTHFYGLSIESTVASSHAYFLSGAGSSIWDCNISSNDAGAVKVTGAASSVSINNSSIYNDSLSSGEALLLQDAQVNINESFISGGFKAIKVYYNATNTINIDKSIIASYKTDYESLDSTATIDFSHLTNYTVTTNITDSVVESSGGPAIRIGNIGGNVALNFIKSKIIRTDNSNESTTAVDCFDPSPAGAHTVIADADTLVCNLSNTIGESFSTIAYYGGAMNFDVTTMNAHTSNTDIGICPYEDGSTNPISY